jgi:membrane-associated phospholipid phosphatase
MLRFFLIKVALHLRELTPCNRSINVLRLLSIPLIIFSISELLQHYYAFNTPLFMFINGSHLGEDWLWQQITFMGDGLPAYLLMVFFCRKNAYLLWVGLIAALLVGLAVQLGKPLLDILRPAAILSEGQIHIIGQTLRYHSFPSGHSATAFVVAGILANVLPKNLTWWLVIGATIIAWSRVKVGAHWPTDVIFGSIIGWHLAYLATALANRLPKIGYTPRSQILLYAFATLCSFALWSHSGGYPLAKPLAHTLALLSLCFVGFIALERSKFNLRTLFRHPNKADNSLQGR